MIKWDKLFAHIFDLSKDSAEPKEIIERIKSGAVIKGTNMVVLILAMFIASIGLNMNSTAVIIGAMLISPLMGVIMGLAYGIATYDTHYARDTFLRLGFQTVFCILASTVYFAISPIETPSSELLARTSPAIWDVLIAIFGGFAGIIGITRKEKSNVIPGVAIATALMPPLCTAGYGLANHLYSFFFGAIYLYFINCLFICLTSLAVLKVLKLPAHVYATPKMFRNQKIILTTISIITILPSLWAAYNSVRANLVETQVSQYIQYDVDSADNRQVVAHQIDEENKTVSITLIGKKATPDDIAALTNRLNNYSHLHNYKLRVIQNQDDMNLNDLEKLVDKRIQGNSVEHNEDSQIKEKYMKAYKYYLQQDVALQKINDQGKILFPEITTVKGAIVPIIDEQTSTNSTDETTNSHNEHMFLAIVYVKNKLSPQDANRLKQWMSKEVSLPVDLYIQLDGKDSNELFYGNGIAW